MSYHASQLPADPLLLIVPGLNNSGPQHWQSVGEQQRNDCPRVDLGMWDRPHRNTWVNQLNLAIRRAERPVILVAHPLGCMAVAWWAQLENPGADSPVRGALLVAPPEVDNEPIDARIATFAPAPRKPLPFPAILVGSHNDPYMRFRVPVALRAIGAAVLPMQGMLGTSMPSQGLARGSSGNSSSASWPTVRRVIMAR